MIMIVTWVVIEEIKNSKIKIDKQLSKKQFLILSCNFRFFCLNFQFSSYCALQSERKLALVL